MKKLFSIIFILLLASSWFASYFTLRLIDGVTIQNKLSTNEIWLSKQITKDLGISEEIYLKQTNIEQKLSLGYAAPFFIAHEDDFYEVVDNPITVKTNADTLKIIKIADSEKNEAAQIINSLFQTYIFSGHATDLSKQHQMLEVQPAYYIPSEYLHDLGVTTPPPQA